MRKELRMHNTDCYTYYNANPKGKIGGDCVIRAIALATGQSWEQTIRELTELGIKTGYVLNDQHVYTKYLLLKGFTQCKEPRNAYNKKMTVKEWMQEEQIYSGNQKSVIVAKVGSHHIACIIEGTVHDIWNSSSQTMHKYWIKAVK